MIAWSDGAIAAKFYYEQAGNGQSDPPNRPATIIYRCKHGLGCSNEARYYTGSDHSIPTRCGVHDITDNDGRGHLRREDFPLRPIPGTAGWFLTWDGKIVNIDGDEMRGRR